MNNKIVVYSPRKLKFEQLKALLSSPLVIAALIGYALVLVILIVYLAQPKSYRSELSLVLPGNGSSSNVILDEIGQVSQTSPSAFGQSHSPRSNYKAILQSEALHESVSLALGGNKAFAPPKITLLQQTSIINLAVDAASPELANRLSWAYFHALQDELDRLRTDESLRRDEGIERVLESYRDRLNKTRHEIVQFQQRSLLISQSQIDHQVEMLATVRHELTFSQSDAKAKQRFIRQLTEHLGVSVALAGHALTLQSDAQFGGFLEEMDASASQLSKFQSQWGRNHPKVRAEQKRFDVVVANLRQRSEEVIGLNSAEVLYGMNLNASQNLSNLFAELLDSGARLQGLQAKISDLLLADRRIEDQLRTYSRESAELERLQRELQRAEAVYNSAAARLEAGKADIFASYPVVQLLAAPAVADEHHSPKELLAIAISLFGILMITLAVVIVWQRQYILNVVLKSA